MKWCLLFFSVLFSFDLLAEGTIELKLYDVKTPEVWASRTDTAPEGYYDYAYIPLVVDAPSGDGRSSEAPVRVYVPAINEVNRNYSIVDNPDNFFNCADGVVKFRLLATNNKDGEVRYLYVAAKKANDKYYVVSRGSQYTVSATALNDEVRPWFTMSDFKELDDSCQTATSTSFNFSKDFVVFMDKNADLTTNSEIANIESGGGPWVYFTLYFNSSYVSRAPQITAVKRGDEQLTLVYTGPAVSNIYKNIVFRYNDTDSYSATTIQDALEGNLGEIIQNSRDNGIDPKVSGEYAVTDLRNDDDANLAIATVDKYQFATLLSPSKLGMPQKIDVFLQKKACYLLSAGFMRESYVIDYFQHFRDHVLMRSSFGRWFIGFYYDTAPDYARYIQKSQILAFMVRCLGYSAYFVFNYYIYLLSAIFLLSLSIFFKIRYTKRIL